MVAAAIALLDSGGEEAVTLRAVAQASDVSHNAPYKHFESRDALLAAVAKVDFAMLEESFKKVRSSRATPAARLSKGLRVMITFSRQHPARYRLLFGNRTIANAGGELKQQAVASFLEFLAIVEEAQQARVLPDAPNATVANLLFATMHGLIAIEAVGGIHPEKGMRSVEDSLSAWIALVAPRRSPRVGSGE